jgi:uncharacterized protein (TIGR02099 family)
LKRIARVVFRIIPLWSGRVVVYAGFFALVVVGIFILTLRYAVLPNIESYRADVESLLSRATGQRVSVAQIKADWRGWRPEFSLNGVVVYDDAGRPALELKRIENSLSWLSLLVLEPRFHRLRVYEPDLRIRRDAEGRIYVAGIPLKEGQGEGGLADWLLRQGEVIVADAAISWIDEARGAPELRLTDLTFRLQSDYHRHRFGLRASAPAQLAGPLDIRGDFSGGTVRKPSAWEGQLYVHLDYVDLSAWTTWLDLPIEIGQGRGALRAWVDIGGGRVTGALADLQLNDVKTRLASDLEVVDLTRLSGRLGLRTWNNGFEVVAQRLEAVAVGGREFKSEEFSLRLAGARDGRPPNGELRASQLDLDALSELTKHLPVDVKFREHLGRLELRGKVRGVNGKWTGEWPPAQYQFKAQFERIAVNAVDHFPGVTGLSGAIVANERQGSLNAAGQKVRLDLPRVFAEPLQFAEASTAATWTVAQGRYDVRLGDVRFANDDMAGTLHGTYITDGSGPGTADLTGALTRAEARAVWRYMPLVTTATRDWLRTALLAGKASEVAFRLKGDLAEFPFRDARRGTFRVTARTRDGVLVYAPGWPRLEGIAADLVFEGARMEINATGARILNMPLGKLRVAMNDLERSDLLEVAGDAEGPTSEFLRFITESPAGAMIDRFTEGMEAQGNGRLALRMTLPLENADNTRLTGSYQFRNNRLRVDSDLPALEQVDGRLEFTESSVRGQGITAQIFGGPAAINLSTQDGVVAVAASGRANLDALRRLSDHPFLAHLSGGSDWRSTLRIRARQADFTVESSLVGVQSNLPFPLAKSATEAMPLRFERRLLGGPQDQIDLALGKWVSARLLRRRDAGSVSTERVAVGLGAPAPVAEGPGIWLRGQLPSLDLDRWRALLETAPGAGAPLPGLASVDLKFAALDVFARRFNDVAIAGRQQTGDWRVRIDAKELAGEVGWQPQGKGRVVARLQRLALPAPMERLGVPAAEPESRPGEYPALDIVVEDFRHNARNWGHLQLEATPEGRNWRIDRLVVRNPQGVLSADGLWQWQARVPRTEMNYKLEVSDIGRYLARTYQIDGVRGGTASLFGKLAWNGAPQDFDLPSLSGTVNLEARSGQFTKLEPGIGKLLSIFNLQALPRRVALDFKDIFSEGFSFDSISGEATIKRGVATTQELRILASSATVLMSGDVDLVHETQKLKVRVIPSVGDSVATVTALLGGPVAGLGVFLAQRLLKDPLGQLIAYDYAVTGTWSDPNVVKLSVPRAEPG